MWRQVIPGLESVTLYEATIHLVFRKGFGAKPTESEAETLARQKAQLAIGDTLIVEDSASILICARRPVFWGGRTWRANVGGVATTATTNSALPGLLRRSHRALATAFASPMTPGDHAKAATPATQRERRLLAIGLLAPDIQRAILEGRAPAGLTIASLTDCYLPVAWAEQRKALGFIR